VNADPYCKDAVTLPGAGVDGDSIIGRAFLILSAFRGEFVLGVSELARRTGLPRTTVHRLANQLLEVGALSRVGTRFRVGASLFELGNLHYPQRLRDKLQPLLDDLARMTSANVSLLELVGSDVIVIASARPRRSRCSLTHLGFRFPAHACAGGQVLLAHEGRRTAALTPVTADTIIDERKFRRRLIDIRAAGLGIEHGEAEVGWSTVAIPAVNRHGRILGSIMLKGETDTFDLDAMISTLISFGHTFTAAGQQAAIGFFAAARPRPKP
jgi:IclR family transcriptional regulator, acetate operon repressor